MAEFKIKSIDKFTSFTVETNDGSYVRSEGGGWQKWYGDSLECEYSREEELEAVFQEYVKNNNIEL